MQFFNGRSYYFDANGALLKNRWTTINGEKIYVDGNGIGPVSYTHLEDCEFLECYTRQFNYPEKSRVKTKADLSELGVKTFFCSDVCAAYDRVIYNELGGFPRPAIFNEDMIFTGRLIEACLLYTSRCV